MAPRPLHYLGLTFENVRVFTPSLIVWGLAAVAAVAFYGERVPLLRKDIFYKIPILNKKYNMEVEDSK